jgi:hypothetical protein
MVEESLAREALLDGMTFSAIYGLAAAGARSPCFRVWADAAAG